MKYWINKEGRGDKLIVISDDVIYNSNPSIDELESFKQELHKGNIPKALTGIPFRYMKRIEASSKNNKLIIYHGKENNSEIDITNEKVKREIIEYLLEDKANLPEYQREHLTKLQTGFKQSVVILITVLVIYLVATMAVDIKEGGQYEARGGIGALLIGLAEILGREGISAIGSVVLVVMLYKLVKSIQNPPIIESLIYHRAKK